jgi:hypothetical protein
MELVENPRQALEEALTKIAKRKGRIPSKKSVSKRST